VRRVGVVRWLSADCVFALLPMVFSLAFSYQLLATCYVPGVTILIAFLEFSQWLKASC
jgi:hypothetical protein